MEIPIDDRFSKCDLTYDHLNDLSESYIVKQKTNNLFEVKHERWTIEFLSYIYNDIHKSSFSSFDESMKLEHMMDCLFDSMSLDDKFNVFLGSSTNISKQTIPITEIIIDKFSNKISDDENEEKIQKSDLLIYGASNFYKNRSQYVKVIQYSSQALKIKLENGESACYTNLGIAHRSLSDHTKAIEYYEKSLKFQLEIGDISGSLQNIASMISPLLHIGKKQKALYFATEAKKILVKLEEKTGEKIPLMDKINQQIEEIQK